MKVPLLPTPALQGSKNRFKVKVFEDLGSLVPPAVDDYWPLLGADAVPERSHKPVGQVGLDGHDCHNGLDVHDCHND